jgi:hypothetical protein
MKCGARVALGVAGGYFLGRTKKMKLGLMLAGMAAGRQAGGPGALLGQGKNLLNASPELLRLTDEVKGRLLDAGKGAALAVATRQVEALTDRVAGRVESSLGNLGERGRGATNSSGPARDDVDDVDEADGDDQPAEDYDSEPRDAAASDEDRDKEPRESASDEGSSTSSAPVRRARGSQGGGEGNGQARRTGGRTAERRTTAAASGARRSTEKAAGRPARARRSNTNG